MEKCYRDIQDRGQIAGMSIIEIFILIGLPLILFPIFTVFNLNVIFILALEVLLVVIFRLAGRLTTFDYGLASFVLSRFVWPSRLSSYTLDEQRYIKTAAQSSSDNNKEGAR